MALQAGSVVPTVTPGDLYRSVIDQENLPECEQRAALLKHRLIAWKEAIYEDRVSVSVTQWGERIVHVVGKGQNDGSEDMLLNAFADKLRTLWEFEIHRVRQDDYSQEKFSGSRVPIKFRIDERGAANFIEGALRDFYIETDTQLKSTWIAWVIAWFRESVFGSVPGRDFLNRVAEEPWHHTTSKGAFHYANAHPDFLKKYSEFPDYGGLF